MTEHAQKPSRQPPMSRLRREGRVFEDPRGFTVDETLTDLQVDIFDAIQEAWRKGGEGPTLTETAHALGCSMPAVVNARKALKRQNLVVQTAHRARGIRPRTPGQRVSNRALDPWEELRTPEDFFIYREDK